MGAFEAEKKCNMLTVYLTMWTMGRKSATCRWTWTYMWIVDHSNYRNWLPSRLVIATLQYFRNGRWLVARTHIRGQLFQEDFNRASLLHYYCKSQVCTWTMWLSGTFKMLWCEYPDFFSPLLLYLFGMKRKVQNANKSRFKWEPNKSWWCVVEPPQNHKVVPYSVKPKISQEVNPRSCYRLRKQLIIFPVV